VIRLLTFSCYGSHLPGDPRGSFDHVRNGERKFLPPNPALARYCGKQMSRPAYFLSTPRSRELVRAAIVDVCRFRSWPLYALHVRTTHVHGVVDSDSPADRVLHDWKAYATRALRSAGVGSPERTLWSHGGNSHSLISRTALNGAIQYVIEGKGEPMETFSAIPPR
jgi:REP element-mobilizing transposase RayT